MRLYTTIVLILFFHGFSISQVKVNYDLLNRSFGLPAIIPQAPLPAQFAPANASFSHPAKNTLSAGSFSDFNNDRIQQQNMVLMQGSALPGHRDAATLMQQRTDIENDIKEFLAPKNDDNSLVANESYRQAFSQLTQLDPDNFSISRAVFLVENAYFDNKLSYASLANALQERAQMVKQILKKEKLTDKSNLALNYGIQKLYSQANSFYSEHYKRSVTVPPFKYDFEDYRGEKDYSKMFVYKMLSTGRGQCHSMPLLYLMIAEQLGAKANLSLAPQHSFIQFANDNGKLSNFETTNGNPVSTSWLIQSGYITSKAIQNKTYLDTLSQRQLYGQMLGDLLLGYLSKFRYDGFAEQIRQMILQDKS